MAITLSQAMAENQQKPMRLSDAISSSQKKSMRLSDAIGQSQPKPENTSIGLKDIAKNIGQGLMIPYTGALPYLFNNSVSRRFSRTLYNDAIAKTLHTLGKSDMTALDVEARNIQKRRMGTPERKGIDQNEALLTDELHDIKTQLTQKPEARESEDVAKIKRVFQANKPDANPFEVEVSPAKNVAEKITDTAAGITAFIGQLTLTRGLLPKGTPESVVWETQSLANGGAPGSGAAMFALYASPEKILSVWKPTTKLGKFGKAATQTTSESALMGGQAAIAGGSKEDILISAGIPFGFAAVRLAKKGQYKEAVVAAKEHNPKTTMNNAQIAGALKKASSVMPNSILETAEGAIGYEKLSPQEAWAQVAENAKNLKEIAQKTWEEHTAKAFANEPVSMETAEGTFYTPQAKYREPLAIPPESVISPQATAEAGKVVSKTFIHETNADFDKFDVKKIGSGQGESWLGRGIYLHEKGGFKFEQYGKNKIEATLLPDTKIFEVVNTPEGKYRDTFVEYAVQKGIDGGLAQSRIDEGLSLKNLLPRDILKLNPEAVNQLKKDGYDGLYQDGELVVYNPDKLKISQSSFAPPAPEDGGSITKTLESEKQKAIQIAKNNVNKYLKPTEAKPLKVKRFISDEAATVAKKRLFGKGLRSGVDPRDFADALTIGAYHFENGVRDFAKWSKLVTEYAGDWIKPHLKKIWDEVKLQYSKPEVKAEIVPEIKTKAKELGTLDEAIKITGEHYRKVLDVGLPKLRRAQSAERGKRFGRFESIYQEQRKKGVSEEQAEESARKIAYGGKLVEEPLIEPPPLSPKQWAEMFKVAGRDTRGYERTTAFGALKKMRAGNLPRPAEIRLLREIFGDGFTKPLIESLDFGDKAIWYLQEISGAFKSLQAGGEVSALGRQGLPILTTSPKIYGKFAKNVFKGYAKPETEKQLKADRLSDPDFDISKTYGVQYSAIGDVAKEETFISRLPEKIPLYGNLQKRSEAAFVEPLNTARFSLWKMFTSKWQRDGTLSGKYRNSPTDKDIKQLKELGSFISNLTGRSSVGRSRAAKSLANFLNLSMFSPRNALSRITGDMNPIAFAIKSPFRTKAVNKIAVKSLMGFVSANALIATIAYLTNPEDNKYIFNPLSTDFMKVRDGQSRYDFTAGFGATFREMARIMSGYKMTASGKYIGGFKDMDFRVDEFKSFARSKEAPLLNIISELYTGKNFVGNPVNRLTTIPRGLAMLFLRDAWDAYKNEGVGKAIVALGLAAVGIGVQTYPEYAGTTATKLKDQLSQTMSGKNWDELGQDAQQYLRKKNPAITEAEQKAKFESSQRGGSFELKPDPLKVNTATQETLKKYLIPTPQVSRSIGKDWYLNDERYKEYQAGATSFIDYQIAKLQDGKMKFKNKDGFWITFNWQKASTEQRRKAIEKTIQDAKEDVRNSIIKKYNQKDLAELKQRKTG